MPGPRRGVCPCAPRLEWRMPCAGSRKSGGVRFSPPSIFQWPALLLPPLALKMSADSSAWPGKTRRTRFPAMGLSRGFSVLHVKLDYHGGLHLLWFAIQLEGLVFPLPNRIHRGLDQDWVSAHGLDVGHVTLFINQHMQNHVALNMRDPGHLWIVCFHFMGQHFFGLAGLDHGCVIYLPAGIYREMCKFRACRGALSRVAGTHGGQHPCRLRCGLAKIERQRHRGTHLHRLSVVSGMLVQQKRTKRPLLHGRNRRLLKCRIVTVPGTATKKAAVKRTDIRDVSVLANRECDHNLSGDLRALHYIGVVGFNFFER